MRYTMVILLGSIVGTPGGAEDWPHWRGPRANGTWQAPPLPERWPADGLRTVWKQPIGPGYAGITVADGRLFTMDLEAPLESADAEGHERVLCLDASTGELIWTHRYPVRYGVLGGYNNGPRASATIHDGRVYTLGAVGHVFCFDATSGEVLWSHDMVADFDAEVPMWGFAASPVIDGERVLIHAAGRPNGSLMAFNRLTGEEIWRSLPDQAGYSTPILIDAPSGRQITLWTPEHIHGLDPETGEVYWSVPYPVTYGVSIASPIYAEGIVFVTGYWEGSKAIRLGDKPTDAELIWEDNENLRGILAQPLYRDGLVYTIDKSNGLTCFELQTGHKRWDDDNTMTPRGRNPHASFVWIDEGPRILSLNSEGEVILAELSGEGYREQSRTKVLTGQVWSHPAFAGQFLYARTDGAGRWQGAGPHELICVELAE